MATWYLVPWLKTRGRADALESGKSPAYAYRFVDHARYLDAWFEALHLTSNVTLVVHDWGSALGFHRTTRYPEQIKAIAYMEAITMPLRWEDFGEARGIFQALRSPQGEPMIFNENVFVEAVLPRSVLRSPTRKWPLIAHRFSSETPVARRWSGRVKSPSKVSRPTS